MDVQSSNENMSVIEYYLFSKNLIFLSKEFKLNLWFNYLDIYRLFWLLQKDFFLVFSPVLKMFEKFSSSWLINHLNNLNSPNWLKKFLCY